jgi:RNA polymerase sigma-70 factor (ECF subfamily)
MTRSSPSSANATAPSSRKPSPPRWPLARRDRTLLRYRYIDDLDIDAIGAVYRVHRATAARWLQRIRRELLEDTRARLAAKLAVKTDELDSILRFIGSQLDISIGSALR